jgi:ABC-2 type transport system permease protein
MSARRLWAIVRRVTQEIRRDHPSLALLFVVPIVMTGLITFIVREAQVPAVSAVIVNEAGARGAIVAGALATALETGGIPVDDVEDAAAARAAVEAGEASVAIVLPADLGSPSARITLLTNGLDPAGEAAQLAIVRGVLVSAAVGASGAVLPAIDHSTVYGAPSDDPIAPYAPAIVAFLGYFFVYILTGISFLRERVGGTLERLMATPVTRGEVVGGYVAGFGLFAAIQVGVLMVWTLGTVHVPAIGPLPEFSIGLGVAMAGSPVLAYLVVLLLALGAVSLGIFLSTFARTELQIMQFIPLVMTPQFLLSGVLFPVSSLPDVLQPFVGFMPVTYAVDGLRLVFIAGADLSSAALVGDLLVLGLVAVAFTVIASLTIRRDVV